MSADPDPILPHSLKAEQACLGYCLMDLTAAEQVLPLLSPEDFYPEAHRIIFSHMRELLKEGILPDLILLADALNRNGLLKRVGGEVYLCDMLDAIEAGGNPLHSARTVKEYAGIRKIIRLSREMEKQAIERPESLFHFARQQAYRIYRATDLSEFQSEQEAALEEFFKATWPEAPEYSR